MTQDIQLLIGGNGETTVSMNASMANRHGMVAGATGTGKTVTLQILAENFSKAGVPVFLAVLKVMYQVLENQPNLTKKSTNA